MSETKKNKLHWIDFVVLAIIFFGYATYGAIASYFGDSASAVGVAEFSKSDNFFGIITEILILAIAGIYLWIRKFDFRLLNFSINKRTIPLILLLVVAGSLATDIVVYGNYWLSTDYSLLEVLFSQGQNGVNMFGHITISLFLFSLLNGFYEELFFVGLTFATKETFRKYVVLASIFVRFIFHIYHGIPAALGIALAGVAFILVRRKENSIVPFIAAHAIFDIFGAGILGLIGNFFG